ncbi:unnamed protein product [Effrenium voratum]|nr:unnamed protein product [Effrenium voratum]
MAPAKAAPLPKAPRPAAKVMPAAVEMVTLEDSDSETSSDSSSSNSGKPAAHTHTPEGPAARVTTVTTLAPVSAEEVLASEMLATVEAFLAENPVDADAADRLRQMPQDQQQRVLDRGSLRHARNPSAVLAARMKDVEGLGGQGAACATGSHPGIEALIATYNLDGLAASTLRSLPKHKQDEAARMDLSKANQPSAFLMAQLKQAKFEEIPVFSSVPLEPLDSML